MSKDLSSDEINDGRINLYYFPCCVALDRFIPSASTVDLFPIKKATTASTLLRVCASTVASTVGSF